MMEHVPLESQQHKNVSRVTFEENDEIQIFQKPDFPPFSSFHSLGNVDILRVFAEITCYELQLGTRRISK